MRVIQSFGRRLLRRLHELGRSESRFGLLIMAVLLTLVLGQPALAQGEGNAPQYMEPVWQASYWNNVSFSGYPVLWRSESALNYNWGTGSPDPRINADYFSARWSRNFDLAPGTYRFTVTSDDGVRVWFDGQLLIDGWYDHAPASFAADKVVSSGDHMVMVEYYERAGGAMINLTWNLVGQPGSGAWRGEYYNGTWLGGAPVLVRDDAAIDFSWGDGSPAPGLVGSDRFSARWTRELGLAPGLYRFSMTTDDGGRLWVNGNLIIDAWHDSAPRTYTGDAHVTGGPVSVRMEYYENAGIAVAKLTWLPMNVPPAANEIIVDDGGPGFVQGGSPTGWRTAYTGHGGRLTWTKNNDWKRPNYNWARWYPSLQPGWYEVYVYVPFSYSTTRAAQYWVSHYHGYTRTIIDQSSNGDRWISLGTYRFRGTSLDYVSLNDTTYEPYLSTLLAFDAVKWVRR